AWFGDVGDGVERRDSLADGSHVSRSGINDGQPSWRGRARSAVSAVEDAGGTKFQRRVGAAAAGSRDGIYDFGEDARHGIVRAKTACGRRTVERAVRAN